MIEVLAYVQISVDRYAVAVADDDGVWPVRLWRLPADDTPAGPWRGDPVSSHIDLGRGVWLEVRDRASRAMTARGIPVRPPRLRDDPAAEAATVRCALAWVLARERAAEALVDADVVEAIR